MSERLLVAVLGNRHSGKSKTWRTLFGHKVSIGYRKLPLYYNDCTTVFVIPSSPQEKEIPVNKLLGKERPRIVLCAIQYSLDAHNTIDFFVQNGYTILLHWLNPGYNDKVTHPYDQFGLISRVLGNNSLVGIRSGKGNPYSRCANLKDFIYGWAMRRSLINK